MRHANQCRPANPPVYASQSQRKPALTTGAGGSAFGSAGVLTSPLLAPAELRPTANAARQDTTAQMTVTERSCPVFPRWITHSGIDLRSFPPKLTPGDCDPCLLGQAFKLLRIRHLKWELRCLASCPPLQAMRHVAYCASELNCLGRVAVRTSTSIHLPIVTARSPSCYAN